MGADQVGRQSRASVTLMPSANGFLCWRAVDTELSTTTWHRWRKTTATTIREAWGRYWPHSVRERHESMIIFCSIEKFFYEDLAGIRGPAFFATRYTSPGYRQISIRPRPVGDLQSASASIKTVRGMVSSTWNRTGNSISLVLCHSLILG